MEYKDFAEQTVSLLRNRFNGQLDVEIHTVRKNNSVQRTGVLIKDKRADASPVIYLEPFFDMYEKCHDMEEIVAEIMNEYRQNEFHFDVKSIMDFDSIRDRIIYVAVNMHMNEELLREAPYRELAEDLAVVYRIMLDNMEDGSSASARITNTLMDTWSADEETLWACAKENNKRLKEPICRSLFEVLSECLAAKGDSVNMKFLDSTKEAVPEMYVLTSRDRQYGASVIADKAFMKKMFNDIGSFFILPSSLHEVIAIPEKDENAAVELKAIVQYVNETQLEEEEVLADQVYKYDGHSITVA